MDLMERADHWKSAGKARRQESKLQAAEQTIDRLEKETSLLRDELDRSARERGKILRAVEELASSRPRRHRLRRLLGLTAMAGTAYVVGAQAGREPYEQIKRRLTRAPQRLRSLVREFADAGNEIAVRPAKPPKGSQM